MAGDWIKMRVDLRDDPTVFKLAEALGLDELHVIGALFCFWAWVDKYSVDGHVDGATSRLIDKVASTPNFAEQMQIVGWLALDETGATIPNFERHNTESSKERAQKNARQARWRAKKANSVDAQVDAYVDGNTSTEPSTREEKRREEKKEPSGSIAAPKESRPKSLRKCPDAFAITPELFDWAETEAPRVNIRRETEKFRDHTFKTAHSDWAGAWRNWIRRASEGTSKPASGPAESFRERDQRLAAEKVKEWAPGIAAGGDRDQNIIEMEPENVFALQSNRPIV
jgi:hypothetical protein